MKNRNCNVEFEFEKIMSLQHVCCVEIDRHLEAYYITLHNDRDPVRNCPKKSVTVPDFANFFVMERPKSTSSDP